MDATIALALLIFLVAALYASVGHGGASGYLAAMALFGLAPLEMKPTALVLNIFVSAIALAKNVRVGRFNWALFWPFAVTSVPFAYLGGLLLLPGVYYKPLIALVLVYVAVRFFRNAGARGSDIRRPSAAASMVIGSALGFLCGLVGVGGGIFLSPLLIAFRWEEATKVSGIAAAFILVNSVAGLLGFMSTEAVRFPEGLPLWTLAAVVGGYAGAEFGSKRFGSPALKRALSVVLLLAAVKMVVSV